MTKKVTKNQHSKRTSRKLKRRSDRLSYIALFAFVFLCLGSFAMIPMMNVNGTRNMQSGQWYVEDEQMEILAPPSAVTLEGDQSQIGQLPFFAQTVPTPTPTATPEPTQTPVPMPVYAVLEPEVTLEPMPVAIKITAVGDCTLGGDIPTDAYLNFASYVQRYGYDYFFENVRPLFEGDDLTIVNLEGPLTTSTDMRAGRMFNFRGDPSYVNILSGSSVEICNVANNHGYDFGSDGLIETQEVLEAAQIGVCGFGNVYFEEVKGATVCALGFTEWDYTQEEIERTVRIARSNCDLLIVSMHWGEERRYDPSSALRKLGRAIIDAGADIVIGNHSHVYGGIELYNGKYIIYSLGNFCFGGNRNPSDKNCTIFQQTFVIDPDGTLSDGGISIIPARISSVDNTNNFQPCILEGEAGTKLLNKIAKVSKLDGEVIWMEDGYEAQNGLVKLAA